MAAEIWVTNEKSNTVSVIDTTIQAKLLRILETGQFRRLGGTVRERLAEIREEIAPLTLEEVVFQPDQVASRLDDHPLAYLPAGDALTQRRHLSRHVRPGPVGHLQV